MKLILRYRAAAGLIYRCNSHGGGTLAHMQRDRRRWSPERTSDFSTFPTAQYSYHKKLATSPASDLILGVKSPRLGSLAMDRFALSMQRENPSLTPAGFGSLITECLRGSINQRLD